MLVQYVRKTWAVHRSHKYGSGETGLIFTDGLALSKSLPFPAPLFLPTHHLPCLFRSQAFWGSRLSCFAFVEVPIWHSLPRLWTDFSRSRIQCRVDTKWWLEMTCPGNWTAKRDRLLMRQEHVSATRGTDLKCLWRRRDADYAQWPICLSICTRKFNFVSTGLHWSPQSWLISRPWSLRLGLCSLLNMGPNVIFFLLSLLETPLVVRSTGTVSPDDPD